MRHQALLFSPAQTQALLHACQHHAKTYGPAPNERTILDAADREGRRRRDEQDARCQQFFEYMLRPPQRA